MQFILVHSLLVMAWYQPLDLLIGDSGASPAIQRGRTVCAMVIKTAPLTALADTFADLKTAMGSRTRLC
jgi:hypothetical protein